MNSLDETAPAFIDIAHRIVWATVATVDRSNRPRSRVLHPIWEWDGERLVGWIATSPTPLKVSHLEHSPFVSVNYWDDAHDVATAECAASWHHDDETCTWLWERFASAPEPLGYDPSIIPFWHDPAQPEFAAVRLDPWRLRAMPGVMMGGGPGELRVWSQDDD